MKQHLTDIEILTCWKEGDNKYFNLLYKRYFTSLLSIAIKKLKSVEIAKEIVQDVFLEVYLHQESIDPAGNFKGYLFTILQRKIISHYRKELSKQLRQEHAPEHFQSPPLDASEQLEFKELQQQIINRVNKLPKQCKTVFELSRYEMLSHKEIAAYLNISTNTVEQHIRKALRRMGWGRE